ncbi:MAG: hypothetical protein IPK73_16965 [Candidatus Obscuribacter sp.]|nr:hypothetical protein [Candidatus Obscuribacter sp.]MBK9278676.1 hypothetical protein [Candidatus Obscuribacter sp.]
MSTERNKDLSEGEWTKPFHDHKLDNPDVQQARTASAEHVETAKSANLDKSDGSLSRYQTGLGVRSMADQCKSIELTDGEVVVSRTQPGNEAAFQKTLQAEQVAYDWADVQRDWAKVSEVSGRTLKEAKDGLSGFIYRGREDEQMDYKACSEAFKAFPEFSRHPNVDKHLIAAIIRNELHFYSAFKDAPADGITTVLGNVPFRTSTSLGPAQIQEGHVSRLMQKFPQLSDAKLGKVGNHPVRDLLDRSKAPWFVAAYLAESVQDLEIAGQPVTNAALIQKYNQGGTAHHNNVMTQLDWIKKHHPN